MKSYDDKKLLFTLLCIGGFAGLFGRFVETRSTIFSQAETMDSAAAIGAVDQNIVSSSPAAVPITLGFAGSIDLSGGVATAVKNDLGGEYSKLLAQTDFLKQPDITFADLQVPASDMNTAAIPALKNSGIDIVALANDTANDWNRSVFENTLAQVRASGMLPCGAGMNKADAETPAVIDEDGFSVGFLCISDVGTDDMAATDTASGILLASDPNLDEIIHTAASQVNALVVSFDFGTVSQKTHSVREEQLADQAANDGAVMVVGEYPSAPEDNAVYDSAPIFYNLGNFISDKSASGLYVTATLTGKTLTDVAAQQVVNGKNFVPSLASGGQ